MPANKQPKPPDGKCEICGENATRRMASRHVKKCRAANPLPAGTKEAEIFTLMVTAPPFPEFFLVVEIGGDKTLASLDQFLRDTWLECCGHLSAFTIKKLHYNSHSDPEMEDMEAMFGGKSHSMSVKIKNALDEGETFDYEYDFGTTSDLKLRVLDIRRTTEKQPANPVLLMRNLPPEWKCRVCQKPATIVGATDGGLYDGNVYCEACAKKELEEYERSPILNSPRSGLCGYGH